MAPSYTCSTTLCTPLDNTVDTMFRRLQGLANSAAQKLGMGAPIATDGKIGPATVRKLYDVSNAMPSRPDLPLLMTMDASTKPSFVAGYAARFIDELLDLIEIQMPTENVPPWNPGTIPTPTPGAGPVATTIDPYPNSHATAPFKEMTTAGKVIAGGAALTIAGLLYFTMRKKKTEALQGARRRRRRR